MVEPPEFVAKMLLLKVGVVGVRTSSTCVCPFTPNPKPSNEPSLLLTAAFFSTSGLTSVPVADPFHFQSILKRSFRLARRGLSSSFIARRDMGDCVGDELRLSSAPGDCGEKIGGAGLT